MGTGDGDGGWGRGMGARVEEELGRRASESREPGPSHGPAAERPELGLGEPTHCRAGTPGRAAPLACSDWSKERDAGRSLLDRVEGGGDNGKPGRTGRHPSLGVGEQGRAGWMAERRISEGRRTATVGPGRWAGSDGPCMPQYLLDSSLGVIIPFFNKNWAAKLMSNNEAMTCLSPWLRITVARLTWAFSLLSGDSCCITGG